MSALANIGGVLLRKQSILVVLPIFISLVSGYSRSDCSSQSGNPQLHLVELYSSEGCDSCPPAERWMTSLRDSKEVAGLEFHVDYWDSMQWRDPFSSHAYTERQEALAKVTNHNQYYTPQIFLDGQPWQNWPKGAPPNPVQNTSSVLAMKVVPGTPLRAMFDLQDPSGKYKDTYQMYAAVTENGLSRSVTGGENKGKRLSHDNVVRALVGPLPATHADVEFKLPENVNLANARVVGFLQNEHDDAVIDVVRVPLDQCLKQ